MFLKRLFTNNLDEREDYWTKWKRVDSIITGGGGKEVFRLENVEAPAEWSENAVNIVASKYFKKIDGLQETSVKQLINRVVNQICKFIPRYDPHERFYPEEVQVFKDELTYILSHQMAWFNSPVWFNFGVPGRPQTGAACFLLDVDDDLTSINEWISLESRIFKAGSGAGVNISKLRREDAPLSAGGSSSGPLSFMKGADAMAGIIKSGGVTRRAAKMVVMDMDHPDIMKFINSKINEEKKIYALVAAGFASEDARNTVAYQNANISVRVDSDFMERVLAEDPETNEKMDAIASAAWECGDPGLFFTDNINDWYTIPNSGPALTSNPCSEIINQPCFTACNLASINLMKFWDPSRKQFDIVNFRHTVDVLTVAMDIIAGESEYPDERITKNSKNQRHIGIGFCNLGSVLMSAGISYDSDEGRLLAARISSLMTGEAFKMSTELARVFGEFNDLNKNREEMRSVLNKFKMNTTKYLDKEHPAWSIVSEVWKDVLNSFDNFGARNANVTAIAPTGTIAFAMDAACTGIEPELGLVKNKHLVGGGTLSLVNPNVNTALYSLGYDLMKVGEIMNHIRENGTVIGSIINKNDHGIFSTAFGDNVLDWSAHVNMVAAVQPYISEGISKTINMPPTATIEEIKAAYIDAWHKGIKSISVYRDGSKNGQPLEIVSSKTTEITEVKEVVNKGFSRRRLPQERQSITHKMDIAGFEGYMTVGLYEDGTPGELFINASKQGSTISGLLDTMAIVTSMALQYGVPLESLTNKLKNSKFEPSGFCKHDEIKFCTSVPDYIFKWLELKFKDVQLNPRTEVIEEKVIYTYNNQVTKIEKSGDICTNCGSLLVMSGTCKACPGCGNSLGGCGA